jgi:hypothetical protein
LLASYVLRNCTCTYTGWENTGWLAGWAWERGHKMLAQPKGPAVPNWSSDAAVLNDW